MLEKILADSRMIFRIRTEMLDVKDNIRGKYKGCSVYCDACDLSTTESQSHVMNCPEYA